MLFLDRRYSDLLSFPTTDLARKSGSITLQKYVIIVTQTWKEVHSGSAYDEEWMILIAYVNELCDYRFCIATSY